MNTAITAVIALAATLGAAGLAAAGTSLFTRIRRSRCPASFIPVSLVFISLEGVLAVFFAGLSRDGVNGAVNAAGTVSGWIWAVPALAAVLSLIWFIILDARSIGGK